MPSSTAASGRVVLGWFSARERGLAMGIRQTAQPLGVAIAAATLPVLAAHFGFTAAVALPAVLFWRHARPFQEDPRRTNGAGTVARTLDPPEREEPPPTTTL